MRDREFKALKLTAGGKAELVELLPEQSNRIPTYIKALEVAAKSRVPDPKFSNYFVRESIGSRTMHEAGNIEYGFCQALHGEESAVAVLRASQERERDANEPLVLGIVAGNPGNVAAPCGNCRDIMRDVFGPELEIVSGSPEGGITVVAKLSDYLFDKFQACSPTVKQLQCRTFDTLRMGKTIVYDGYSPTSIHPERRYFAGVFGRKDIHVGALDLMCDYHPIYPLRDATRQARRVGDARFDSVVIVGQDTSEALSDIPPHVMYKDRQHLMEFNLEQELLTGKDIDPSVYLVRCQGELEPLHKTRVHRVWQTSVKEWLPFPFSPRNFGPEFISGFTQYLKSRL